MEPDYKNSENYKKGLKNYRDKYDPSRFALIDQFYAFSPALADVLVSHGLYEIWEAKTPNLSIPQKEMIVFSSLVTSCTVHSEIKAHTHNLLKVGMSKQQIIEMLILLTLYIGVPKVVVATGLVVEAFKEYDNKG